MPIIIDFTPKIFYLRMVVCLHFGELETEIRQKLLRISITPPELSTKIPQKKLRGLGGHATAKSDFQTPRCAVTPGTQLKTLQVVNCLLREPGTIHLLWVNISIMGDEILTKSK